MDFHASLIADALALAGVAYEIEERSALAGRSGHISSGNLHPETGALEKAVRAGFATGHPRVLISSELLFDALIHPASPDLGALRIAHPDALIRVLLFVRDPLDHATSHYHQMIKRDGYTGSFADSLQHYRVPQQVCRLVRVARAVGADVTVFNYSRHTDRLLPLAEGWLGLPDAALAKPPLNRVNRSMTLAELELQRQFNIPFGKEARRYISDALCNLLPDIRSETPKLPPEALAEFLARMGRMTAHPQVIAAIPATEAYRVPPLAAVADRFAPAASDAPFAFSADQLHVIAQAISTELRRQIRHAERNPKPRAAAAGGTGPISRS